MTKYDTGFSILGWGVSIARTFDRGPDMWFIEFQWQWRGYVSWRRYFWDMLRWSK